MVELTALSSRNVRAIATF